MSALCTDQCVSPKVGQTFQHCKVCHQSFGGTVAGDMHRVGKHGVDRRCLTASEMEGKGLHLNSRGVWSLNAPSFAKGSAVEGLGGLTGHSPYPQRFRGPGIPYLQGCRMKGWRFDREAWESALLPQRSYVRNVGKVFAGLADGEGLFSGSQGWIAKTHKLTRSELTDAISALRGVGLLEVVTQVVARRRGVR